MSEHVPQAMLSALADGELQAHELAVVQQHLAGCPHCTAAALEVSLLKRAVARGGQRYAVPEGLEQRVLSSLRAEGPGGRAPARRPAATARPSGPRSSFAWGTLAAALLLVCAGIFVSHRTVQSAAQTAFLTEAIDEHVAALSAGAPQVLSSDRHTVKPWFQGKLPFSFNLPQTLPPDTTLDGADLAWVDGQPAAQLLFSIGRHRVSVFIRRRTDTANSLDTARALEHNGFHLAGFHTQELDVTAVSDVEPARLLELVHTIEQAQAGS